MFSRGCQYAIRALIYLAERGGGGPYQIREVAEKLDIPYPFLAKVVQNLVSHDLLVSRKGPGGGIALAKPADTIRLLEVVQAVDGPTSLDRCVLGLPECDEKHPCALHHAWVDIRESMLDQLENESLKGLIS